jgi:hypothetical protein
MAPRQVEPVLTGVVGLAPADDVHRGQVDREIVAVTGGDEIVTLAHREYRTPKRELAATVQVLLQTRRLCWADRLPAALVLQRELENFKATITLSGHDSYAAGEDWRQTSHDDLVLATALACWFDEFSHDESSLVSFGSWLGRRGEL